MHGSRVLFALFALFSLAACSVAPELVDTSVISFPGDVLPTAIASDGQGGYCLAFLERKPTDSDAHLACVDPDRHGYFARALISGANDHISGLSVLPDGAIAVTGYLGRGGVGLVSSEWSEGSSFAAIFERWGEPRWVVRFETHPGTLWSEQGRLWVSVGTNIVELSSADGAVLSSIPAPVSTSSFDATAPRIAGRFSDGSFIVYGTQVVARTGHWSLSIYDHGSIVGATISPEDGLVHVALERGIFELFADDGTVRGSTARLTSATIRRTARAGQWRCYSLEGGSRVGALSCFRGEHDWRVGYAASGDVAVSAMAVEGDGLLWVAGRFRGHGFEGALDGLVSGPGSAIFVSTIAVP